ncbi:phosphoribosylformylglycinamidine cyclo-ligase [Victivallis sp. Marseille-Q1083]|uniref:phosphoribosylformylglycinamidine cyclo-ligase n=1 Tax=Victivallis sp. Marseille-Q1083 TaxID=2717288 RepID=UPI00158F652B|nr:phosphoribosylformylglycinamidine cyclo-ligase [Victivallis sp. Marseille-Q1083]
MATTVKSDLYKSAGVDIDLAHSLLDRVKERIAATRRPEMLAPIGGFGGLFQLDLSRYRQPVLVSSVDGVGTKLMIAMQMNKFDTVGYDIVNHCIDDIAVQGAEPIYFMDYIGIGKLRSPLYEEVLFGIAEACKAAGCAVLGGETAEMPGMYGDDFDLVGMITGIVEKDKLITGEKIRPGYAAIGLKSAGLHTNGFSLARKILFDQCKYTVHTYLDRLGETVGEALLRPHICYWPAIRQALAAGLHLDGIAHITGGGLYDNVPRILPADVDVVFDRSAISTPPIFKLLVEAGQVDEVEAFRVFNMGVGMVWFLPQDDVAPALKICRDCGFTAEVVGEVIKGDCRVTIN